MKKVLILLAFVPLLFGCEEFFVYDEISEPHLTGKPWTFVDYQIQVISSISEVDVVLNDTVCINAFGLQSMVNGDILMQQDFESTPVDRKFVKGVTQWEFDDNSYTVYINGNTDVRFPVTFPNYMMKEYDKMEVANPLNGAITTYSYDANAQGANYPTEFVLLSPDIVTDLYLSNGMRDKAVTVQVMLVFRR
jgi:hypothetical protein